MTDQERKELILSFADNSNKNNLGIFKFAKYFFADKFYNDFNTIHHIMVQLLFSMFNPSYKSHLDRLRYFLVHREAAKSTIGNFLFPMYCVYMDGYAIQYNSYDPITFEETGKYEFNMNQKYILICSDAAYQAESFVSSMRSSMNSNFKLKEVFGAMNPKEALFYDPGDRFAAEKDRKWTRSDFTTATGVTIRGVGSGQKTRGTQRNQKRPTLIIVDDMYSQENTLTEQSRRKLDKWFKTELLNTLDSVDGGLLWLGTLVHPDTVIKNFRINPDWRGVERPIISINDLQDAVSALMIQNDDGTVEIKSEAIVKEYENKNVKTLSWKERKDLYAILRLYRNNIENLSDFYQEYMNEAFAPEQNIIAEDSFIRTEIKCKKENDGNVVEFTYKGISWKGRANLTLGIDIAASETSKSDDTVFTLSGYARCHPFVPGLNEEFTKAEMLNGKVFPLLIDMKGGKYGIKEYGSFKGMAEEAIGFDKKYNLNSVAIEINGQQLLVAKEIEDALKNGIVRYEFENNKRVTKELKPSGRRTRVRRIISQGKKEDRIAATIQKLIHRYQSVITNTFEFKTFRKFFNQCIAIGMLDHDDYADSFAISIDNSSIPERSDELQTESTIFKSSKNEYDWYLDS